MPDNSKEKTTGARHDTAQTDSATVAWPAIIQGGMGAAVSSWRLARATASRGALGVVSGTGIDQILARRLQMGDPDGSLRRAINAFPCRETARQAIERYYSAEPKPADRPFKNPKMFRLDCTPEHFAFAALAAFVEVWLAKEGHDGPVGINLLEKIAMPNPSLLFGATLAGVDYVLMGAGIPWQIPGILDKLAACQPVSMRIAVEGDAPDGGADLVFDPRWVLGDTVLPLRRPRFLAIVSSATLAQALLKRATGRIDGFVVEYHIAGGHNAPPRGAVKKNERGEPIYGERDAIDLKKIHDLGLPFWLAGGQGVPGALQRALDQGAVGIQVGTLFALCEESGLEPALRRRTIEAILSGKASILTDGLASPTGFPFKVIELADTLSEEECYLLRKRVCDSGYLRRLCRLEDGTVGYRCPAEPADQYVAKGGDPADTPGRKCLCNALLANVGLPQVRAGGVPEGTLLTAGDELVRLGEVMGPNLISYTAADALECLLGGLPAHTTPTPVTA